MASFTEKGGKDGFLIRNAAKIHNRILIGTPVTGVVRVEWMNGRFGQIIPTNWSHVDHQQWMNPGLMPLGFPVADAENLIAKSVIEGNFEWLLFYEHDNIPPNDAFIKLNQYMIKGDVPVVAGMYFTKSVPPEPMVYRGPGKGYYADWKLGEKVWASGIPFGFTLIHGSIIRALWEESPEYVAGGTITRRVFHTPSEGYADPDGGWMNSGGTSDLQWCRRLMDEGIFEKAGWPEFQKKEFPFLVDTSIFVKHIDNHTGVQYPIDLPKDFVSGKITWREALKRLTM